MRETIEINVVAYRDGDLWVAQCVEYDIAAFAATLTGLPKAFERAVASNLCVNLQLGRSDLEGIPAPPPKFRDLFDDAKLNISPTDGPIKARSPFRVRDLRLAEAA